MLGRLKIILSSRFHFFTSMLLTLILATIYCQNFLFSKDTLPGGLANDFYFTEGLTKLWSSALKQGIIPVTSFWIENLYGGGYPNAWSLASMSTFLLSVRSLFFQDFFLSLKIFLLASLVLAGMTSYYYGLIITKSADASLVFSVAYTFSSYLFAEFYWGHINLVFGVAIIPLVLALWERNLSFPNPKNAVLSGLSLILLLMTELQLTFFVMILLFFRFIWRLLSRPLSLDLFKGMVFYAMISVATFILLAFPVLTPFLAFYEITRPQFEVVSYLFYPYSFFLRATQTQLGLQEVYASMSYVGIIVLIFMMIPIFLRFRDYPQEISSSAGRALREFPFYLAMFVFYLFLASGWHAPIDITDLVYRLFPFSSSIRVYSRCSILVNLSSSISASIGYIIFTHASTCLKASTHQKIFRAIKLGKKLKINLLILLIVLFIDLSYGFEPIATPIFQPTQAYHYLRYDDEPFRVVEIPVMWAVSYYSSSYVGHSIIGSDISLGIQPPPQIQDLESIFRSVPSKMFIKNGGFEHSITQWGIYMSTPSICSAQVANVSLHGRSSLRLSIRSDQTGDFVKVFQLMSSHPPVTKDVYISFSILLEHFENAELDVSLTLVNKASNGTFSLVYGFACGQAGADSGSNTVVKELNYTVDSWNRFHQSILDDSGIQGEREWYIDKLEIYVRNRAANGQENDVLLYVDDVAIYELSDIPVLSALYGVKYVLLHTGEAFYEKWRLLTGSSIDTDAVELYLNLTGFEKVYQYENDYVYENENFRGYFFAVKSDFPMFQSNLNDVNTIPSADADVNYVWKDVNTIAISVSAREPILLMISQTFHMGWRASDGNQTFAISEIFGVMGIRLRPGTYFITLHFHYYEESLLLFPVFYLPLLLLVLLVTEKRRVGSFSKKALRRLIIGPLSFYGPVLAVLSLTLYERIYAVYSNGRFVGFGLTLSPFGHVILWFSVSIVAGVALLFLLAGAREGKVLSGQTIALGSAFTALVLMYWLSIQEYLWTNGILCLLTSLFIASSLNIFQCFIGPLTLRDSPSFLEAAYRIYRLGSHVYGASTAFMKARVKAFLGVGLASLTVRAVVLLALTLAFTCVHLPILFRDSLAEVYRQTWVNNKPLLVLVGYRIKDPYAEELMWIGLLIIAVLSAYVFLAKYRRALLSTTNLGLFCALSALYFKYRLTLQDYTAHIPINVLENEFLPMLVAVYIASNMLLLHALHRPMIFREEVTVSSLLTNQVLRCLALLTLGLTLTANFLQPFSSSLASLVAVGAFYFFLSSALLYMVRGVYVYLMHRRREGLRISGKVGNLYSI